jgi:hypothetical protein
LRTRGLTNNSQIIRPCLEFLATYDESHPVELLPPL